MRRALTLLAILSCCTVHAQVWEKYLAPGLSYRMEYDAWIPRTIHALHFDMHSDKVRAVPELANATVYEDDKSKGRATVSAMVHQTGALAGVNASFFPYTGRPVGLMVRNRELISSPYPLRPQFGWGPSSNTALGMCQLQATCSVSDGSTLTIDSINDEAKPNSICLDTDTGALALASAKAGSGTCAIFRVVSGSFEPNGTVEGEILYQFSDSNKVPIQKGNAAIMGTGSRSAAVAALRPGQRITINTKCEGFDWSKIENCVCGGPYLLLKGAKVVDAASEGFNPDFYAKRHPRTAIGRDARGDLWLVVVDGRQPCSVGVTLDEMADVMGRLGCRDAINLDGGGSSTFNVMGVTLNRPGDGVEREVANAIMFYGPATPREDAQLSFLAPNSYTVGDKVQVTIAKGVGGTIPNSEVLWSATGAAWIDQGGMLRVVKDGAFTLTALAHGQTLTASFTAVPRSDASTR